MCVCTGVWLLPEGRWSYRSDTPQIHNDNIDNYLINSQSMTISFGGVGSALWISGVYGVDPDGIQILKCFRSVLWRDRGAAALTVSVLKVSGRDGRDKRPRQEVRTELKGQKFDAKWFMNVVSTVGEWLVTWLLVYCCVWKTKKIQTNTHSHTN